MVNCPVSGPGNHDYDRYLEVTQIRSEDVIGAYGFNMLLNMGCDPLNMLPSPVFWFLDPGSSCAMGYGCCTPLWYNPGSLFCGTWAGPVCCCGCSGGCCAGPAHPFATDDLNWGSPKSALRSQFEQELRGEGMASELANAESVFDFKKRFLLEVRYPSLNRQAVHLNNTWAKGVNERLLMPAGYFCVLRSWEPLRGGDATLNDGSVEFTNAREASFLQLLIVKGDEEAMKRMTAAMVLPETMERDETRATQIAAVGSVLGMG